MVHDEYLSNSWAENMTNALKQKSINSHFCFSWNFSISCIPFFSFFLFWWVWSGMVKTRGLSMIVWGANHFGVWLSSQAVAALRGSGGGRPCCASSPGLLCWSQGRLQDHSFLHCDIIPLRFGIGWLSPKFPWAFLLDFSAWEVVSQKLLQPDCWWEAYLKKTISYQRLQQVGL